MNPSEILSASIYLRPKSKVASSNHKNPYVNFQANEKLSREEFVKQFSADKSELEIVMNFAHKYNLNILETDASRRIVKVSGTVEQMNSAFGVDLVIFEFDKEQYRGYNGFIYLPNDLANVIDGVFGLDNKQYKKSTHLEILL